MFCKKCGEQNLDNAAFCNKCGTPLQREISTPENKEVISKSRKKKKWVLGIITIILIVIIAGVAAASLFGNSIIEKVVGIFSVSNADDADSQPEEDTGYTSVIKQYIKAVLESDVKTLVELFPGGIVKNMEDLLIQTYKEDLEYYGFVLYHKLNDTNASSYTNRIINTQTHSFDNYKLLVDNYAKYGDDIDGAKILTVQITIKSSDSEFTGNMDIGVVKVEDTWYLDYFNLDQLSDLYGE